MTTLEVRRDLDFVDGEKRHIEIARHRLDGGDPVTCMRRLDLFFAGDERDRTRSGPRGDLVVDLARQQTQRQTDDARRVSQHPLDREMGLAGVGRAQHRRNTGSGRTLIQKQRNGRRQRHIREVRMTHTTRTPQQV